MLKSFIKLPVVCVVSIQGRGCEARENNNEMGWTAAHFFLFVLRAIFVAYKRSSIVRVGCLLFAGRWFAFWRS
ncbi:MAG: hypothetical protein EBT59_03410 [Betaproteobacteria bacterium]|nr:hypothetical protein [Betaproteobacteria bacterium]